MNTSDATIEQRIEDTAIRAILCEDGATVLVSADGRNRYSMRVYPDADGHFVLQTERIDSEGYTTELVGPTKLEID